MRHAGRHAGDVRPRRTTPSHSAARAAHSFSTGHPCCLRFDVHHWDGQPELALPSRDLIQPVNQCGEDGFPIIEDDGFPGIQERKLDEVVIEQCGATAKAQMPLPLHGAGHGKATVRQKCAQALDGGSVIDVRAQPTTRPGIVLVSEYGINDAVELTCGDEKFASKSRNPNVFITAQTAAFTGGARQDAARYCLRTRRYRLGDIPKARLNAFEK